MFTSIDGTKEAERKQMKGQAATESLVLLGFIIALSIPVALLLFANSNIQSENVAMTQAKISTSAIVDSANEVWAQGDGASRVVLVNYPSKLLGINVSEREVTFRLDSSQGAMDVSALGFANMSDGYGIGFGKLNDDRTPGATYINAGLHDINITNNGTNIVVTYVQ